MDRSAGLRRACEKNAAALLPHMKTRDNAQDMDDIRAALGVPRISYYGFSYGTYLGQVYATLYPSPCAGWCSTATWTRDTSGTKRI